ncbi:unnamed protein product [Candida verbasci]|uniref:Hyaluronan/mRNA-binding protein domain-containing protein n=1 Tax=Candida verbasci TaxID=1227364 RepID=A0A9W4XC46_9ASCO|nr:unnamed protein product [Candida verbasci]
MSKTKKWGVHEKKPTDSKWFTHNHSYETNPTKIKKNGAGKNNWGKPGDEIDEEDEVDYKLYNKKSQGRRNSNHDLNQARLNEVDLKTNKNLMI